MLDEDYPEGHLVPMTDDEEEQLERDQGAARSAADAQAAAEDAAAARLADLRKARLELATGRIFASFTASERSVLDALLAKAAL